MESEGVNSEKYSLLQLKSWCAAVGVNASGAKASLAARLNELSAEARGICPGEDNGAEDGASSGRENVTDKENVASKDKVERQRKDKGASKEVNNGASKEVINGALKEVNNDDDIVFVQSGVASVRSGTFGDRLDKDNEQPHNEPNQSVCERDNVEMEQLKLELVQKELEVLQLKKRLLEKDQMAVSTSKEKGANNVFEMLKEIIPKYEGGDDFNAWQKQLLHYRDVFNVDDATMGVVVHLKLRGAALAWYNAKTTFPKNTDELLKEMKSVFASYENKFEKRRKFEKRMWSSDESFPNYFNDKCVLSSGLNLSDGELADYLVEGIPDGQLRIQAKLQNFSTASEVVRAFCSITLPQPPPRKATATTTTTANVRTGDRLRCYNCNCTGHYAKECQKPKREAGSCFACGEQGHYAPNCKHYKKTPAENNFNA
ncbi:uncharacterized protein LOC118738770 [Rhagoletis pomonella]|uniref:uncharacterized protein LOC118738770 n=1 Tax=Rhagoletis pomonella TaxID=28610 RepID=UPI00178366E5|nr:uncharacterized protein LOC118738770 [Rhagoletis pomonella]